MTGTGSFGVDFAIRSARPEDALPIAQLAGELGYPIDTEPLRARLAQLGGLPGHWVGIAAASAQGQAVAGWIHMARAITLESGEYGEILGLVVAVTARRRGIGRHLVAAAERWAGALGLVRVTVRSNVLRGEAHQFYPSLGYAPQKRQQVYVKMLPTGADH